MSSDLLTIANLYYDTLRGVVEVADLPLTADVSFIGPLVNVNGPDAFRAVLEQIVPTVMSVTIRHQCVGAETVITIYDFDCGLDSGAVLTAETITIVDGRIAGCQLIFDSAPFTLI